MKKVNIQFKNLANFCLPLYAIAFIVSAQLLFYFLNLIDFILKDPIGSISFLSN